MALDRNIFSIPNNERSIDSFKSRLIGGGARPNLFEVELNFPSGVGIFDDEIENTTHRMMIKGAQLPASNIAEVIVPFRGRQLKVAGDRRFDPWTITIINDVDFKIRTAFERWMNLINKHEDNSGLTDPTAYQKDLFVRQLGRAPLSGVGPETADQLPVLKMYKFHGTFPTNISDIPLSYDSSDTLEEFSVELQVQWFDALDSQSKTQLGTGS